MKIEFLEIRWKNFLSYPNDFSIVILNSHKTNLITGVNGSGKSTLLDVLSFALYNKPFRDINKPELVNEINNRDCLVELTFVIGPKKYLVRRGIRPNIFEIFENERLLNPRADAVDYQDVLEKQIIRCNHRSFLQTVILGSGNYVPFMQLTIPQRREVIESLLDLKVFSAMQIVIKQDLAEISTKMVDNQGEKVLLEKQIDLIEENRRLQKETNEDAIKKKEELKVSFQLDINCSLELAREFKAIADSFLGVQDKLKVVEETIKKYRVVQDELDHKRVLLKQEIDFLTDHDACPMCKQSLDSVFRKDSVEAKRKKIDELNRAGSKLINKLVGLEKEQASFVEDEVKQQAILQNLRDEAFHVEQWTKQIKNLDEEIIAIRAAMVPMMDAIEPLEAKIGILFKAYNKLEDNKYQCSVALDLVPLIKTAIIKKYIPFFNKQILFYLQKFDSLIRFVLNEYFEETIVYRGRDKLGYGSLSEGEKFRVNLAVLFAWRAVARSRCSIDCNLLFLDEIMDSSLDIAGVESFMKIIQQLNDGTFVYVISHKEGDFADSFDRVFEVKKCSNFSKIFIA